MDLTISSRDLIKTLKMKFSQHRSSGKRRGYSPGLRTLAVEAMAKGLTRAETARSSGVAPITLTAWRRAAKSLVRELKVVKATPARRVKTSFELKSTSAPMARMIFQNGNVLEFSMSALTAEVVQALQAGTPC